MTVQEIGLRWGVHYNTVYKLIRDGALVANERRYKSQGIHVAEDEVKRYEAEHNIPADKLTAEETMDRIGCSRHLLGKYIASGLLSVGRIEGSGRMFFSEREVEEFRRDFHESNKQ